MLTDAEEFCSIPGKELQVVVRGCTIRIGNMTWLLKMVPCVTHLKRPPNATPARAI